MVVNVNEQRNKEIAWTKIAQAVSERDFKSLTKYFYWLYRLMKETK